MATYRQTLNRVLRILGEDQIGSSATELSEDYPKLVGTFVNFIKEEIEDAHNWRVLRTTYTPTVTGGSDRVTVTGANERSRLAREHDAHNGRLYALVFDVTDADEILLREEDLNTIERLQVLDDGQQQTQPEMFAMTTDSSGVPQIVVYPTPVADRDLSIVMITPQDELEDDDLDTNIAIPALPLQFGAMWFALEERGEELGVNSVFTEKKYRDALDSAIARDQAEQGGLELVPV